ncbi:MAG TPA: hypothetical protein VFR16_04175 [Agromyces mariniharenae]|nr:hypothetical protein [Agromyces mariniharenae]
MNGPIPVVTSLDAYRVAVAGLPIRARLANETVAGAIVVVDGDAAWWDAAATAVDAGAGAVLVSEPREVPVERATALVAGSRVPIVVHRARLRQDLVTQAVAARDAAPPRIVVAEARGSATALHAIVRDAVGWIRALGGGPLGIASAATTSRGGFVLLRSRDDGRVVGSMILAASEPRGELLRVRALGETGTEVEIDEAMGRWEVATSTAAGRTIAPTRFEEGERAALRRAVDAVASGTTHLPDLEDLLHDVTAAAAIAPFVPESALFS